jgi:hypothetical protein
MAQITYRGNLSAKVFPFVMQFFGPTVIVQGQDQNFQRQLVSQEDLDKDRGIPQILYCHNVMPSAEGFQSIGYQNVLNDVKANFKRIYTLRDVNGNENFFAHTSDGNNYVLAFGTTSWVQVNSIPNALDVMVTVATINGQSYIYFANLGCYMYDAVNNVLVPIILSGLDATQVIGITASSGYMVAWTANSIAWSSTVEHDVPTDPIDFVPSLETGAGGGNVEAAKGKITFCVPHYLGFIVYTTDNAVASVYSGNARFPFNLREIVNSGGVSDSSLVSFDSSSGNHYAYTTSGLQLVSISQTQTIFPDITDFIAGNIFEDFDETALQFVYTTLTSQMLKAINVIADRYLVVSYGITSLTHALVYDIVEKRFGKLKVPHVTCFEWKTVGTNLTSPRQCFGFLQSNGSIKIVDFGYLSAGSKGVMVLGKYQYMRARTMTLDEVEVEDISSDGTFQLYNMVSYDGKTLQPPVAGYLAGDYSLTKRYTFRQTGINHSLLATGNFFMNSIVMKFHINGRR